MVKITKMIKYLLLQFMNVVSILVGNSDYTAGLRGIYYCSEDIIYLDCTQKINVDNPKTLINTLNKCNSTQLNEIKTILGIV